MQDFGKFPVRRLNILTQPLAEYLSLPGGHVAAVILLDDTELVWRDAELQSYTIQIRYG